MDKQQAGIDMIKPQVIGEPAAQPVKAIELTQVMVLVTGNRVELAFGDRTLQMTPEHALGLSRMLREAGNKILAAEFRQMAKERREARQRAKR